jgi:exodeoxyribonuclease V beta subunit
MKTEALDLIGGPLDQVRLIEASAGTGKTYAICLLYLRLLIERAVSVKQILVVSFTKAATAELRERIRARLSGALHRLHHPEETEPDAALRDLLLRYGMEGRSSANLIAIIDAAIADFDESAIYTIHGFCKRVLDDEPFVTGMPLEMELEADDALIRHAVLLDLYREWLADPVVTPAVATRVWKGDTLKKLDRELRRWLSKPRALPVWDAATPATVPVSVADEQTYQEARDLWRQHRDQITARVMQGRGNYPKNTYSEDAVRECAAQWDQIFDASTMTTAQLPTKGNFLDRFSRSKLNEPKKQKGCAPIEDHPFFDLADRLLMAWRARDADFDRIWSALIRRVVEIGPVRVAAAKRRNRTLSYDDLLKSVYDRLTGPAAQELAASLRTKYPVALVDEFQDTDPLQYGVFSTLYGQTGTLFMVGDPKQAIYSFRNADLNVYLEAGRSATAVHTLSDNQRSSETYLTALNAIFGLNPRAFLIDDLNYHTLRLGAKRRPPFRDDGAERGALHVWTLTESGDTEWPSLSASRQSAAQATAAEIARLLSDSARGLVQYDNRPLRAGDIAVIVPTKARGREVRSQLAALNIGAVEISRDSVYATDEAEDIDRILAAVLEPTRVGLVKAALATALLGCTASGIAALASDDQSLVEHVERFVVYRDLWHRRGVGVMLRRLMAEYGVEERVLTGPMGERRLTNLRHLLELIHTAAEEHPTADGLHRWLQSARAEDSAEEVAQMRLESDQNLIQIVSIHTSKGLEYPIVFCPTLWDDFLKNDRDRGAAYEYFDPSLGFVIDYRSDDTSRDYAKQRVAYERHAERLRLIYVALTRAVHRCYLIAGAFKSGKSMRAAGRTSLQWLVTRGETFDDHLKSDRTSAEINAAWLDFAAPLSCVRCTPLPRSAGVPLVAGASNAFPIVAAPVRRLPAITWRMGSYSGLIHGSAHEGGATDRDARAPSIEGPIPPVDLADEDILRFPRGARAGECVHAVFEHADFTDPSAWSDVIAEALRQHPPETSATATPVDYRPHLRRMLHDVVQTALPRGFALATVPSPRRLVEWEFTLPAHQLDPGRLGALLDAYGYRVPQLHFSALTGYIRGFVDLIFEHDSRFYLVDWKSNYLGATPEAYAPEAVESAMVSNGYHLQHLLYTVALHRYLSNRVSDYNYDRHVGGTLYLFVRGVRPSWGSAGIYHRVPERSLIESLSALLGEGGTVR